MRYAVIDLGTNTFNLLIVESFEKNGYSIILNTKQGVKLGEGGINQKVIIETAFNRGIEAVEKHVNTIKEYKVDRVMTFATSAIRDASNGKKFTDTLKELFDLEVTIISGDKEAELIYQGVKQSLPFLDQRFLILDIGGGSNEFIIADQSKIYWKRSFKLGMARLLDRFQPSDPISQYEISNIERFLETELAELFDQIKIYKPEIFVGASGSFDSFVAILKSKGNIAVTENSIFHQLPLNLFEELYHFLIHSTKEQRHEMKELEPVRRDMIVLASIFTSYVLHKISIKTIYQSAYSLKEGAIFEMINGKM